MIRALLRRLRRPAAPPKAGAVRVVLRGAMAASVGRVVLVRRKTGQ
jgi:hypothetical protein